MPVQCLHLHLFALAPSFGQPTSNSRHGLLVWPSTRPNFTTFDHTLLWAAINSNGRINNININKNKRRKHNQGLSDLLLGPQLLCAMFILTLLLLLKRKFKASIVQIKAELAKMTEETGHDVSLVQAWRWAFFILCKFVPNSCKDLMWNKSLPDAVGHVHTSAVRSAHLHKMPDSHLLISSVLKDRQPDSDPEDSLLLWCLPSGLTGKHRCLSFWFFELSQPFLPPSKSDLRVWVH